MSAPTVATDGGIFNARRFQLILEEDGHGVITLAYASATGSHPVMLRILNFQSSAGTPVTDVNGASIGNLPSAVVTAITSLFSAVDSTLSTAGGLGKLNLNQ